MLILISPAKSLNFEPLAGGPAPTEPRLKEDIAVLSRVTARLTPRDLMSLMDISEDLAALNAARFQAFSPDPKPEAVKAAVLAFNGDVYRGLDAATLSPADLDWAQEHLRILSGLYGVLRPLDGLQPYRLEMGTRLKTRRGESLYDFWGDRIAKALNADLAGSPEPVVLNLASKEYFTAVDRKALKARVVSCEFREVKDGEARILSVFAKTARGLMARHVIDNRIEDVDTLRGFDREGYRFDAQASRPDTFVFTRPQPDLKR